MSKKNAGLTLTELLIAMLVMGLAMTGVIGFFTAHKRASTEQDLSATVEANLRVAMEKLSYDLRSAGYGVPQPHLAIWFPWLTGFPWGTEVFDCNPKVTPTPAGTGCNPDPAFGGPHTLSVARCTPQPVARLNANAAAHPNTSLTLRSLKDSPPDPPPPLDAANRRLLFIGESEPALIQPVPVPSTTTSTTPGTPSTMTITIDRDPIAAGDQGLARGYVAGAPGPPIVPGAPICRVDVVTWSVDTAKSTLNRNDNQGDGAQPVVDGITNLRITVLSGGGINIKTRYEIQLTARSAGPDPATGQPLERTLTSSVSLKN